MLYNDPRDLTILTGEAVYDRAIKTFGPGSTEDNLPVKLSDYVLGKGFCHHTDKLIPDMELESLQEILESYSDRIRTFRIYGRVKDFVPRSERIERNSAFIDDPGKLRLFELDIDGWGIDEELFADFEVGGDPKTLREVIHHLLSQRGLEYLSSEDCLLMYSQSAFPGGELKCHLYYWLNCEEGEGFTLEELRKWAMNVNTRLGGKHIDSSVYRAVQPDYIATRHCEGFDDPLRGARFIMIEGVDYELETSYAGIKRELGASAGNSYPLATGGIPSEFATVSSHPDGWYATLHQAGCGGEINQWCFRAAAQCVQTNGRTRVLAELDVLAARMHAEAWGVIIDNSGGARGGQEDRDTYTVTRFAQYLRSACDRNFGDELDRVRGVVEEAIDESEAKGSPEPLFERHVVAASAILCRRWPGVYEALRARISALPRGVRPRAASLDSLVSTQIANTRNTPTDSREAIAALGGDLATAQGLIDGGFIREGGSIDEIEFCNVLLDSIDLMSDGINDFFVDTWSPVDDGGYKAYNLQERVDRVLAVRGMEILGALDRNLPEGIIKKANNVLDSYMEDARSARHDGYIAGKRYGRRDFRRRFYREPAGDAFWVNLGREDDNKRRCMRVDDRGCTRMTWVEALEKFDTAPVWSPGVVGSTVTMRVGANGASSLCGEELETLMSGVGLGGLDGSAIPWLADMWRMIRLEDREDESKILAWLISVMLDWPTKFILQLVGSASAGKSTTSDILRGLLDPPTNGLRSLAETRRSLGGMTRDAFMDTVAKGGDITVIDNITGLTANQQDMLCTIATGTSVSRRWLYHNSHYEMPVKGSIILTGINDSLSRPDLRERVFTVGIRKGDEGDGYVPALEKYFAESEGRIRDGLIDLSSAVLYVMKGDTESAFSGRDGLIDIVNNIYHGASAPEWKKAEKIRAAESDVELDHFSKCFCAWLLNSDDYDSEGTIVGSNTDILRAYREWVRRNAGKNFSWRTASGDDMAVQIISQVGLKSAVPANARKLSEKLNTYGDQLAKVIGMDIGKKKVKGVKMRVLKRVKQSEYTGSVDEFSV